MTASISASKAALEQAYAEHFKLLFKVLMEANHAPSALVRFEAAVNTLRLAYNDVEQILDLAFTKPPRPSPEEVKEK